MYLFYKKAKISEASFIINFIHVDWFYQMILQKYHQLISYILNIDLLTIVFKGKYFCPKRPLAWANISSLSIFRVLSGELSLEKLSSFL